MPPDRSRHPPALRNPQTVRSAFAFVLIAFAVYNLNLRRIGAYDSLPTSLLPLTILQGNGFTLDSLAERFPPATRGAIVRSPRTGDLVSQYPVITSILVIPIYMPGFLAGWFDTTEDLQNLILLFEKVAASCLAAASVGLLFLLLDHLTYRVNAFLLTSAFALGTANWTISSQALWQHGASALLLSLCLLLLFWRAPPTAGRMAVLGLTAGLLTANRPVNVFFSAAIAGLVLVRYRRKSLPFFLAAACVAVLFVAYNRTYFQSILGGYGDMAGPDGRPFWMAQSGLVGFPGLLVSNRGLLVFSPFLLFFFFRPRSALARLPGLGPLLAAFVVFLYVLARTPDWAGGSCYGPRFTTDALPLLVLALVAPVENLKGKLGKTLFAASIAFSIICQAIGAFCFPGGGSHLERLGQWNIENSQPVVALRAGLQSTHFAYMLLPGVASADPLPDNGVLTSYDWVEPPPKLWKARQIEHVTVRVTNRSRSTWSSLGGKSGIGAVRLTARWAGVPGRPPYASPEDSFWLRWRLGPGESVERRVSIRSPNTVGAFRLVIGLGQSNQQLFSQRGMPPLEARVEVQPGDLHPEMERSVEWLGGAGPGELSSGSEASYHVGIRNLSKTPISPITAVGYAFISPDETPYFEASVPLPGKRDTGAVWMDVKVKAQVPPGKYWLRFDLVDYHWYRNVGSPPLLLEVRVK